MPPTNPVYWAIQAEKETGGGGMSRVWRVLVPPPLNQHQGCNRQFRKSLLGFFPRTHSIVLSVVCFINLFLFLLIFPDFSLSSGNLLILILHTHYSLVATARPIHSIFLFLSPHRSFELIGDSVCLYPTHALSTDYCFLVGFKEKALLSKEMIGDNQKACTDCKTTKTPLWRVGPAGPKTLCNACGIRYRKKKVTVVKGQEKKRDKAQGQSHSAALPSTVITSIVGTSTAIPTGKASCSGGYKDLNVSLKIRLTALGDEFLFQRSPPIVKKQRCNRRRKKLGEEEQAAFCLMALSSCGSVLA